MNSCLPVERLQPVAAEYSMVASCSSVQPLAARVSVKPLLRISGTEEVSPIMTYSLSPGCRPSSMKRSAVAEPMPSLSPLTLATTFSWTTGLSMMRSTMMKGISVAAMEAMEDSMVLS